MTFECNPEGSTAVFTATGEATGPYPGTYVETVTVTTGPMVVSRWVDQYHAARRVHDHLR